MIKALINGILKILMFVLNIVLTPINALIENLFPDMANAITHFTSLLNNVIGGNLVFFFHLLPPIFRSILVIWFTFVVSYYSVYYTYTGVLKLWNIIQKIKFW